MSDWLTPRPIRPSDVWAFRLVLLFVAVTMIVKSC
jgi:hypothetical protein